MGGHITESDIRQLHVDDARAMWEMHGEGWYRAGVIYGAEEEECQRCESLDDLLRLAEQGFLRDWDWFCQWCDCGVGLLEFGGNGEVSYPPLSERHGEQGRSFVEHHKDAAINWLNHGCGWYTLTPLSFANREPYEWSANLKDLYCMATRGFYNDCVLNLRPNGSYMLAWGGNGDAAKVMAD